MTGNTNSPIELLLDLGVNNTKSKSNIKTALSQIQKDLDKELDVTISVKSADIDSKAFTEMKKQTEGVQKEVKSLNEELTKVEKKTSKSVGSGSFKPLQDGANKTLLSMKDLERQAEATNTKLKVTFDGVAGAEKYKKAVVGIVDEYGKLQNATLNAKYDKKGSFLGFEALESTVNKIDFDGFKKKQIEAKRLLNEFGRQGTLSAEQIVHFRNALNSTNNTKALEDITSQMKQVNKEASRQIKWKGIEDVKKDSEQLLNNIGKLNKNFNINIDTKEITRLKQEALALSKIDISNDAGLQKAKTSYRALKSEISAITDQASKYANVNKSLANTLLTIERNGAISKERLTGLSTSIRQINSMDITLDEKVIRLKNALNSLNAEFSASTHVNKMKNSMAKAEKDVEKLVSSLVRAENQYKRTINSSQATALKNELASIRVPNFRNQSEIDKFYADLGRVETRVRRVTADATTGARNSMNIIESFKVAMERFPIWMAASTAFYGTVRMVRDITEKIIELDTVMTNLRRVMDMPNYKFNEMLEKSIDNVTNLSGLLSDYMKLVEEFGRMGFNDTEALELSNTAQMLTNISDLKAEESVNSLVAAMIAFNIEANETVRIADVLNEVNLFSLLIQ